MQQYQVPQFIEVEDKIFGPLTVKQFIYILGGVGSLVVIFILPMPSVIKWLLSGLFGSFFAALAFYKVNNRPFAVFLNSFIAHYTSPRLFIWKKGAYKNTSVKELQKPKQELYAAKLTERRLKDLSWSLDINQKIKR
jgi:hypothetical protein